LRNVAIAAAAAVAIVIAGLVALFLPGDPDTPPQAQQATAARSEEGIQEPPRSSGNRPADSSQWVVLLQAGGHSWLLLNGMLFVGDVDNPASYDRVCAAGEGWATMTLDGNTLHLQGPDGPQEIDVGDFNRGQARQSGQCD
jgi:hypothetical protein